MRYFVSFTAIKGNEKSTGNTVFDVNRPIRSIADIREMEEIISKDNEGTEVVIINYQLLSYRNFSEYLGNLIRRKPK